MTIAVAAFSALFNIVLAKRLPMFEGIVLLFHILGFFAVRIKAVVIDQSSETDSSTGSHSFVGTCSEGTRERSFHLLRELWRLANYGSRMSCRSACRIFRLHRRRQCCPYE